VALQKQVMAFEMARALSHERVQHRAQLSDRLNALFDEGMQIDGEQHAAHIASTAAARGLVERWFDDHDVLLAPSTMGEAPAGTGATGDPLFCRGWTLLGLPCVHLPFAQGNHGLPVGLQLVGRAGDDQRLLAASQWCWERLAP
jgi:Asp-tRNA(Asn)/Glu-tRNA(Gln) amidotransferase A subunit family amidase